METYDEDQEVSRVEHDYNSRVYQVDLFIPHAGTFTGLGFTWEEAEEAAGIRYKYYRDNQ